MRYALTLLLLIWVGGFTASAQISTPACSTTEEDNYGPVANDDYTVWPTGSITIPALANDTDVDGDALVITALGFVTGGSASITGNGTTVTFQPAAGNTSGQIPYTISDGQGHTSGATIYLTSNAGADFAAACDGTFCTFTAQPFQTADIRSFTWAFGDSSAQDTRVYPTITHQYPYLAPSATISYAVTLTIDYLSGTRAVVTKNVPLTGPPRQISWIHRNTFTGCNLCLEVQTNITASNLPQPAANDEWRYFMNWGDGTPQSRFQFGPHSSTYPAEILSHSYASAGAKYLELTIERWVFVTGSNVWIRVDGPYAFGGRWVEIVDQPPTVTFTATPTASEPKKFTFNPQGSYDDMALSAATHQLFWDFGDGSYQPGTISGADPQPITHTYTTTGTHLAKLTISDSAGHSTTAERQVTIANEAPVAVMWHGCTLPLGACSFTGLGSRDENNSISSYEWTIAGNGVNATTSGRTIENWRLAPGCYAIGLTVTDEGGLTHSSTRTVAVSDQPLARGDRVVADAHSSTYEWSTSPYGPLLRNTTGNLNGILEPGERVNVEPMVTTPVSSANRLLLVSPVESTNANVIPVVDNNVPLFDQTGGVTDCWRVPGVDRMRCMVLGATVQGTRSTPHADLTFSMPRSEGSSENVPLRVHVGASFTDVPVTAWYYPDVEAILHGGLTSGCGPGVFCPDLLIPRDQLTVWLLRAKYGPAYIAPPCSSSPFVDVNCSTTPFAAWIVQAWLDRIVTSYGDDTFRPSNTVSRADIAAMIVRAVSGATPIPRCTQDFSDVTCTSDPATSHWAADYISELKRLGGTGGCGNGQYCPDTAVSRGEAAAFFAKTWKLSIATRVCPVGTPVSIGVQTEAQQ